MSWSRFKKYFCAPDGVGVRVDPSCMGFDDDFIARMKPALDAAFEAMDELEKGAIANPDEDGGRMVGHYWLRNPGRAPTPETAAAIRETVDAVRDFARAVHAGDITTSSGARFENVLVIGIGGSALGPQFVGNALGHMPDGTGAAMDVFFLDNTDPEGIDRVLAAIGRSAGGLERTLTIVISKSGGTAETRNGMAEARRAYESRSLPFARHAVAITGEGSTLCTTAVEDEWLRRFPLWDWVGGRTSELSAVGLLPAALQGIDIDAMLDGARRMDEATRVRDALENPAALLALMWYFAGHGRGDRDMVVLPYSDRLLLFSRYLQQLVMESLGKEKNTSGEVVEQGLVVYGNKGSTDQHAFIQQLRDGTENFFVTFIQVLESRQDQDTVVEVEPGVTSGDYLFSFLLGTRGALLEKRRGSVTVTVARVDARSTGELIALYERAVGLYASLIGINAYHQPGVQAGKKAATRILELQARVWADIEGHRGESRTADEIAASIDAAGEVDVVYHILEHRTANPGARGRVERTGRPPDARYAISAR